MKHRSSAHLDLLISENYVIIPHSQLEEHSYYIFQKLIITKN